jgi:hypothetical protein
MYDGSQVIQISHDALTHFVENQSPEINDLDQIVWTRADFCDPPPGFTADTKIMMFSGGVTTELTNGQLVPIVPDLNNAGQVAWSSFQATTGRSGIELWENGVTTLLTDDGDNPAINDRGHVAFQRWDDTNRVWNAWLYRFGRFYQLTDDDRNDNVPDINNAAEVAWGSGGFPEQDVVYLRRVIKDVRTPVRFPLPWKR